MAPDQIETAMALLSTEAARLLSGDGLNAARVVLTELRRLRKVEAVRERANSQEDAR